MATARLPSLAGTETWQGSCEQQRWPGQQNSVFFSSHQTDYWLMSHATEVSHTPSIVLIHLNNTRGEQQTWYSLQVYALSIVLTTPLDLSSHQTKQLSDEQRTTDVTVAFVPLASWQVAETKTESCASDDINKCNRTEIPCCFQTYSGCMNFHTFTSPLECTFGNKCWCAGSQVPTAHQSEGDMTQTYYVGQRVVVIHETDLNDWWAVAHIQQWPRSNLT